MEKSKRSVIVLIAFIIGVCVLVFGLLSVLINLREVGRISGISGINWVYFWGSITSSGSNIYWFIAMPILFFTALFFNIFGWLKKGSNRHILIAGILYVSCLNVVSAPLCLTEYFDGKHKIKNKPFLYTLIFSVIFYAISIAIFAILLIDSAVERTFFIYVISATVIGMLLHFIAWKTNNGKAKVIAGIVYVLGIYTVISAILCFISYKVNRNLVKTENNAG